MISDHRPARWLSGARSSARTGRGRWVGSGPPPSDPCHFHDRFLVRHLVQLLDQNHGDVHALGPRLGDGVVRVRNVRLAHEGARDPLADLYMMVD